MSFVLSILVFVFAFYFPLCSLAANTNSRDEMHVDDAGSVVDVTMSDASGVKSFLFDNRIRLNFRYLEEMENDVQLIVTLAGGEIEETPDTHCFTEAACKSYLFSTSKHAISDLLYGAKMAPISVGLENKNDHIRIVASCMGEDLEPLFRLLHGVLSDPSIDAEDFDEWKYKKVKKHEQSEKKLLTILKKINADLLCKPSEVRMRGFVDCAHIAKIDYEGVNRWLQRIFTKAPLEVNIVGDIDMTKVVILAKRYIGSLQSRELLSEKMLPDKRLLALNTGPFYAKMKRPSKTELNAVYVGYVTSRKKSKETELLLRIYAKRLTAKVRYTDGERNNYNVQSFFVTNDSYTNYGFFGAEILCDPQMGEHFAAASDQVMQELASKGPTEEELKRVIKERRKIARENLDDPDFWLEQMTNAFYRNDNQNIVHTGKFPDYKSVSVEDLKALMQEIIRPENHTRIIIEGNPTY